ncbi:MAG TPA: glycosyltransferase, partial [Dehalococcoidia bacterium]|nr:glycosyltransferase [Dehalococcoidia bacterium]
MSDGPALAPDPRVGIVVLTYNRAAELCRTIERLSALPEAPRIVVVDNGSRDGTVAEVARRFPAVECVALSNNTGAAGRNAGVRRCARPYVAFCDDDTWWEPGSLRVAADLLDMHPSLAIVTGRVLVGETNRLAPACIEMANSPLPAPRWLPGAALLGFHAGASVVRREAFLAAGGFEPRFFIGGEEELLALDLAAAGLYIAYVDALAVHHYPSAIRDDAGRQRL